MLRLLAGAGPGGVGRGDRLRAGAGRHTGHPRAKPPPGQKASGEWGRAAAELPAELARLAASPLQPSRAGCFPGTASSLRDSAHHGRCDLWWEPLRRDARYWSHASRPAFLPCLPPWGVRRRDALCEADSGSPFPGETAEQ